MWGPGGEAGGGNLGEEVFDDVAVDVGEAEVAAGVGVGEFFVIEAEEVEDGGVEVVDGGDIDGGAAAEFVGLAIADAAFDTGAHHPGGEGVGVVDAAAGSFLMGGHWLCYTAGAAVEYVR